jgi:hypothetical protein
MKISTIGRKHVKAVVTDLLPAMGMAYLTGDDGLAWTVTRSTPGSGLDRLRPGEEVDLVVQDHAHFALVSEYTAGQRA